MLVLEKLRDNYSSADYATQFLEAAIRKADMDIVMGNSANKVVRDEDIQANLHSKTVRQLREQSRAARRTPPPHMGDFVRPDMQGSGMIDIGIAISRQPIMPNYNPVTAPTPPSHENSFSNSPSDDTDTRMVDNGYNMNGLDNPQFDVNDFLNFDVGTEAWNVPFEEGAHGESGGFVGDMNWIDQEPTGWSRLNSPQPQPEQTMQDLFGGPVGDREIKILA
jgi:hypothetical protein